MRRLTRFGCDGATLFASLDEGASPVGVLIVAGGTEIRAGAHGGMAALAQALSAGGHPVLRFDRRGVGDSGGEDPGFAGSAEDIAAAAAALRFACPGVRRVAGFGLCDGATALALHHAAAGIDALILANPWVIEPSAGLPPPAAIRRRYRERLASGAAWRRALSGRIDYRRALRGLAESVRPRRAGLAENVAAALAEGAAPATILLAGGDATAIGFASCWAGRAFAGLRSSPAIRIERRDTASHSFAGPDDAAWLAAACLAALAERET